MGSCVSLHKHPDSAMKLRLSSLQSNNDNLIIPSPPKHNSVTLNGHDHSVAGFAIESQRGSKDDAFFDSQPWLESDCDEDFQSVNGDFTPSRGSTPVHHKFSFRNQSLIKPPLVGSVPEPSPKKRLSELFKESLRHNHDGDENGETSEESVVIENGDTSSNRKEKSAQCCLPGLHSSRGFTERKRRTSVPNGTS